MATINDVSILHDTVQRVKTIIASGISNATVMSAWPEKKVNYPLITVRANMASSSRMGFYSEMLEIPLVLNIDIWSTSTKERDCLTGSVLDLLRTTQYNTHATVGSGTVLDKLYDFRLSACNDFDEPGKQGLHRKMMEINYKYYTTT